MASKKKGKKKGSSGLLTDEQRRDLLGLALVLLAAFTALSLIPPTAVGFGPGTDNLLGAVGSAFRDIGYFGLGVGIYLVPLVPTLGAIASFGFHTEATLRWVILTAIVTLLLPVAVAIPGATAAAGLWGSAVADPLVSGLGTVGAGLLLGFVAIAASIVTIGWNPARSAAGGATKGAKALKGAVDAIDPDAVSGPVRRLVSSLKPKKTSKAALDEGVHLAAGEGGAATGESGREAPPPSEPVRSPAGPESQGELELAGEGPVTSGPSGPAPPVDALQAKPERDPALTEKELDRLAEVLVDTLKTFKVEGEIVGRTTGPVVTQYEFAPAPGIKVSRVEALDADLALALKAPSVRIVAPIPGKAAVGVEVPNPEPEMVYLREIVEAPVFANHGGQLPLALGKDLEGTPYVSDLAKMPHLLIAGATGSGKSVCINTVITSLIYKHSPETLRLLLIDPKMVELSMYRDLPHLRHPVVTNPEEAGLVLRWMVYEMERRYELLSQNSVRSIAEFNKRVEEGGTLRRAEPEGEEGDPDRWIWDDGPLPYVVLIVDELADLMMQAQADVERPLAQLAQKARAIGIHLIVATQRPSVNVITGLIKANFPSRIGFRVSSKVDSRTILDQNGADALLGNGDMLFLPPGTSDPVRIQGAFVSTEETERLMKWYRDRAEADDEERDILEVVREKDQEAAGDVAEEVLEDWDELFRQAAEVCIQNEQGSTSLLQRRLRVGYGRAARIVDQLEHAGVLGPPDGTRPREVLVGMDGLDLIIAGQSEGPEDLRDDDGPAPEPSLEELEDG
ncbi:MAG: DNA translocase FtsK 4TM domain-containing protein [Candidatus Longimicrobiales bacterium M2_2A_002]